MPVTLSLKDFDYPLDERLIAQQPLPNRDQSRLMRLCRSDGQISHHVFSDLPQLLRAGDLLVLNDTRVIPARFFCQRKSSGKIEGLFLSEPQAGTWEVLLRNAGRCQQGEVLKLFDAENVSLRLEENLGQGRYKVVVSPPMPAFEVLSRAGKPPLPPYIRRYLNCPGAEDAARYQTVYAEQPGAVAAPTAGLHFTPELFDRLRQAGVETARVTLHVGMGTFLPVKSEDLARHPMHREWYRLPTETADALNRTRAAGRRIVAVGTTSMRVLETVAADREAHGDFAPAEGWTDIFIRPPARIRAVGALITNFHLPKSTLLMLVAAFCRPEEETGLEMILRAYAQAQAESYRFFSYGDAMLIE